MNCQILAGSLLLAGACMLSAQTSTATQRPVRLHVVATDSAGNPVADLTASDFAVRDNGSPQQVAAVHLNPTDQARPLVVLFDLLNAGESSRGGVWNALKTSLSQLPPATGPIYLYLLVPDGSLFPVHALPQPGQTAGDNSWTNDIGPLLDAAMQKVSQLKPQDIRAASPISRPARFGTTSRALDEMRLRMASLRGPKALLWVTYGIPSEIRYVDTGWVDNAPFLRQMGARFMQSDITVYTAEPGTSLERGILDRNSLDILAGATGGHAFSTVDLTRAIAQIQADSRTTYSLDFQPPAKGLDGKYHKLQVSVDRKGVRLQTEAGYYAISGS